MIYGWEAAGIVGFLTMAIVEAGRRRPPPRVVFNTGVYVCAAILAGLAAAPFDSDDLGGIIARVLPRRRRVLRRRHALPLSGRRAHRGG